MIAALADLARWRQWPERYGRIMASHSYVPQIDGLRFLAIIQVVIYHAAVRAQRLSGGSLDASEGWVRYWPNGVAGVELFFFISGYIIAYPFVAGRKPSLKAFYMRRVTRLEPPYILAVILCGLAYLLAFGPRVAPSAGAHGAGGDSVLAHLGASLVYAHGLIFHSSPPYNPPLWTLEIEIQFYLLAPLLIALYLRPAGGRARALLAGFGVILAIALQAQLDPYAAWHYTLATHLFGFLLGVATSDWAVRAQPLRQPPALWADALLALGLALFLATSVLFYWPSDAIERFAVLALRAVSIGSIYLGAMRGRWGRAIFGQRWIALIGGACYSIYLLHVPILDVLYRGLKPLALEGQPVLATVLLEFLIVPIALVACLLFYILVERPCMQADWPRRLRAGLSRRLGIAR